MRLFNILDAVKNTSPGPVTSLYSSEATYRYSLLRRMEDQSSALTEEEDGDRGPCSVGEESDEVSASWLP